MLQLLFSDVPILYILINNKCLPFPGSQSAQLVFDSSTDDKPETPGELPDPDKGGLGGTRPLGMSHSSMSNSHGSVSVSSSSSMPHPPDHPPPPPPMVKKPSMPVPPPPPPAKIDQEVSARRCFFRHVYHTI
jgi:hypothetical protein